MYSTAGINFDCLRELALDLSPCSTIDESSPFNKKESKKAPASARKIISKTPKGKFLGSSIGLRS